MRQALLASAAAKRLRDLRGRIAQCFDRHGGRRRAVQKFGGERAASATLRLGEQQRDRTVGFKGMFTIGGDQRCWMGNDPIGEVQIECAANRERQLQRVMGVRRVAFRRRRRLGARRRAKGSRPPT